MDQRSDGVEDEDPKEQADPPAGVLLPAHLALSGPLHWLHPTGGQKIYLLGGNTLLGKVTLLGDLSLNRPLGRFIL